MKMTIEASLALGTYSFKHFLSICLSKCPLNFAMCTLRPPMATYSIYQPPPSELNLALQIPLKSFPTNFKPIPTRFSTPLHQLFIDISQHFEKLAGYLLSILTWLNIQKAHSKDWTFPWIKERTTLLQHLHNQVLFLTQILSTVEPSTHLVALRT